MDERTFLVALIIQKPQNGITCFTQVCTSYCRFDCITHTHTPCHSPPPHTHACMQWNVLFYVVCVFVCNSPPGKHCMSKQANIRLCSNVICRAYIKCMRHIGSTEKFQDIRYKPSWVCVSMCVWSHALADILMQIAFLIFLFSSQWSHKKKRQR